MPRNRRLLYVGIALLLAVGTVFLVQRWVQGQVESVSTTAEPGSQMATVQVLVARRNLPPGTILKTEDLSWRAWPAGEPVEEYFTGTTGSPERLAGAVVRTGLSRGEPVSRDGVVQPGDRSFLAAVLRPGYRAIAIAVSAATGVAGFVRPGDHVDLILSRVIEGQGGSRRVITDTVLRDVRVVAVDQRAGSESNEVVVPQTATIEVTPAQAEVVASATELGKLSLALRSIGTPDEEMWEEESADLSDATAWVPDQTPPPRAQPRQPPAPAAPAVEVIRGSSARDKGESR